MLHRLMNRFARRTLLLALGTVAVGPAFAQSPVPSGASVEQVVTGFQFTEGPIWTADGALLFSDIPANRIYRWAGGDSVDVHRRPSGHSNGLAFSHQGHLLLAQHDGRLSRIAHDGTEETLAASYDGKRLNSPNDLTVASNGNVYFTDPPYGVEEAQRELEFSGVYRLDGSGELTLLADDFARPNGLAFSPDESTLYVNDSQRGHIRAFDVTADGRITNGREFAVLEGDAPGAPDGMVTDQSGRVYSTGPGGIWIFDADGTQLARIDVPERTTNVAWGGSDRQTLYITTANSIYRIGLEATGLR